MSASDFIKMSELVVNWTEHNLKEDKEKITQKIKFMSPLHKVIDASDMITNKERFDFIQKCF